MYTLENPRTGTTGFVSEKMLDLIYALVSEYIATEEFDEEVELGYKVLDLIRNVSAEE